MCISKAEKLEADKNLIALEKKGRKLKQCNQSNASCKTKLNKKDETINRQKSTIDLLIVGGKAKDKELVELKARWPGRRWAGLGASVVGCAIAAWSFFDDGGKRTTLFASGVCATGVMLVTW